MTGPPDTATVEFDAQTPHKEAWDGKRPRMGDQPTDVAVDGSGGGWAEMEDQWSSRSLRAGVSGDLQGLLNAIRDLTDGHGPKYSAKVIHALNRTILCRTKAKQNSTLALSHLLVACRLRFKGGFLDPFYGADPLTPEGVAVHFHKPRALYGVEVGMADACIQVRYSDGVFAIAPSRVPFLSALLEFILAIVDFPTLEQAIDQALDGTGRKRPVEALANTIQKWLYDYLADHLDSVQSQTKAQTILGWLRTQRDTAGDGRRPFSSARDIAFDDDSVLRFWCQATQAPQDFGDFRTFNAVGEAFLTLEKALAAGMVAEQVEYAFGTGTEDAQGRDMLDRVEAAVCDAQGEDAPLADLSQPPANRIKLLKKTDVDRLAPVVKAGPGRHRLPLTVARMAVFGFQQSRLSNALRRGRDIADRLDEPPTTDYRQHLQQLEKMAEELARVRLAVLHILISDRVPEGVDLLVDRLDEADRDHLIDGAGVRGETAAGTDDDALSRLRRHVLDTLAAERLRRPELNALMHQAQRTFAGLNRQGFDLDRKLPQERVAGFLAGDHKLDQLEHMLRTHLAAIRAALDKVGGADRMFSSDLATFVEGFTRLYGARLPGARLPGARRNGTRLNGERP